MHGRRLLQGAEAEDNKLIGKFSHLLKFFHFFTLFYFFTSPLKNESSDLTVFALLFHFFSRTKKANEEDFFLGEALIWNGSRTTFSFSL